MIYWKLSKKDRLRALLRRALPVLAIAGAVTSWSLAPLQLRAAGKPGVRPAAVAGKFYPEDATRLTSAVKGFLADAVPARRERPLALVLPHAGYVYSGQIAADGWRQAMEQSYDLVVVLGTNHTRPQFEGMSVWAGGGFRTPLGVALVDEAAAAALLAADPACRFEPEVHASEHSIEVQVPFAQIVLPGVKILPAVVGAENPATCERLGRALAGVVANRRALIVASSDLSHYPPAEDAAVSDRAVLTAIAKLDAAALSTAITSQRSAGHPNLVTCACGEAPIRVALAAVRALGARHGTVLSWATSGDTSVGERDRVVGYGAVMFDAGAAGTDLAVLDRASPPPPSATLGPADKRQLLAFARETIRRYLDDGMTPLARNLPAAAERLQGAFVTLEQDGQLRGCIGHMAEDRPLGQVVGAMALAAALEDPRFPPVVAREVPALSIEISVLTPMQRVAGPAAIVVGRDGVVIRKAGRSAVFLPQVAGEQGWDRTALLENLCAKAGLDTGAWKSDAEFSTFQAIVFRESEFQ